MAGQFDTRSSSSSTRRFVIDSPSPELVKALIAQIELPANNATESWRVVRVRGIEVEAQIERTVEHGSQGTTEQRIVWDEPASPHS